MNLTTEIFPPAPPVPGIDPDLKVAIILTPCFSLLPLACLVDCLRFAADSSDYSRKIYCHWQIVAADTSSPVQASCGIEVYPEEVLTAAAPCDYVVVIGGRLPFSMDLPAETVEYITQKHKQGCKIIGICNGSFALASIGLLDGRPCAVNDAHLHQMRVLFPAVNSSSDSSFIDDGDIITCNGGTTSLDLVFSLLEKHCGKARAVKAMSAQVFDHRRLKNYATDRPYGHLLSCGNWRVEQSVRLMEQNFSKPLSVAKLAERVNTSVRALNRAFKQHANESPSVICRDIRLAQGYWLLTNTARTITQISLECGFADAPHFSRSIKRCYGLTPGNIRKMQN